MGENEFGNPPDNGGGTPPDDNGEGGTPPDNNGEGGTPPDDNGEGGNSSSSVSYSAATSITAAGDYSNQTYSSETADENSVLVSLASGTANLINPTVTKSGDSDGGDNCNFYGMNSAVLAIGGGTVSISGGTVTANATGANGIFSYGGNGGQNGASGDGTTVYIDGTTINTTGDNGGGIMTTGGGNTVAKNLTISTTGRSSAPIRTDRGGGNVTVSGGSYTSNGLGSPAIYSTADIVVENATLTSNQSEGVCIEGQNSVALTNCTLTANNTATNGQATFLDAIMIYQSMSGDSSEGTATFSMTGGKLINKSGHVFHVTNTNAVINLSNVTIDDSGDGILLSVCDDGWSGASNVATLNASGQALSGDILVGDDSTLTLNLTNSATFTGKISGAITNASGSTVSSTVGTVNVNLDASSKLYLSEDTYISAFSGDAANVISNGYNLYVGDSILDGTTATDDNTTLSGGNVYVLEGTSTVENFNTGFGEGTDTIQINGDPPAVDFKSDGLAFYDDTNSITLSNVKSTAKINLYYTTRDDLDESVFIADDEWYKVSDGAAKYYVGATAKMNHGIDFSDISDAINVTLNTDYSADTNFWINNVHSIKGGASFTTITGSELSDTILAGTGLTTIDAGDGNDIIQNTGNNTGTNFTTASANDTYTGHFASISAGNGDDFITNDEGNHVTILAGEGNDTILNIHGYQPIIFGGAGDDSINITRGHLTSINAGAGNDTILGTLTDESDDWRIGGYATINGGAGNDYINLGYGNNASIDGGAGNDTILTSGEYSTLNGGSGDDLISNVLDDNVTLESNVKLDNVTINAGRGNDTIQNGGDNVLFKYSSDDGDDLITGFNETSTLSIAGGNFSSVTSGNDVIISVNTGNITLSGAADLTNINISYRVSTTEIYTGGDKLISDYISGDTIILGAPPTEWLFNDDDFYFGTDTGVLVIKNARDKILDFRDGNDNAFAKAYAATNPASIDGRGLAGFEFIVGSDAGEDLLFAGDDGSSLWGGAGDYTDNLIGGAGTDIFVVSKSAGNDLLTNASSADEVNLRDVTLSDIAFTAEKDNTLAIAFNNGNNILVGSTEALSAKFNLADGSSYRYNHDSKSWI